MFTRCANSFRAGPFARFSASCPKVYREMPKMPTIRFMMPSVNMITAGETSTKSATPTTSVNASGQEQSVFTLSRGAIDT